MQAPSKDTVCLLPRARLVDVFSGKADIVGSRLDPLKQRGIFSPLETKLYTGQYFDTSMHHIHEESKLLESKPALLIIIGSLYSRLLFGKPQASNQSTIFGMKIFSDNLLQFLNWLENPYSDAARTIVFANANNLNHCALNSALRSCFLSADLILPDGVGLRLAGRISGFKLDNNLNGTDLLPHLCDFASRIGSPISLIGGSPGIAEICAKNLTTKFNRLNISAVSDGYDIDEDTIITHLNKQKLSGKRSIVLVGLGTPKQEIWVKEFLNTNDHKNCDFFCVGGLFDYYSGSITRAPQQWRDHGFEWLWRLFREPRRLFKRYVLGIPFFLLRVLVDRAIGLVKK